MATKDVHYRRFEPTSDAPWHGRSLQHLLTSALAARTKDGRTFATDYEARTLAYPADADYRWLIHNLEASADNIFGTLCLFSPSIWAAVLRRSAADPSQSVSLEEALHQLEVAERPPAQGEDFLRGISYWLIVGNHLFVIQHISLQTKAYEQYFGQLFGAAKVAADAHTFGLTSIFDRSVIGGDLGDITHVEIGGIARRPTIPVVDSREPLIVQDLVVPSRQRQLGTERVSIFEKASAILETLFGEVDAERIMSEVPPEAELEVDVRFGYRTRRRTKKASLSDLAEAARNLPDGEVKAFGRDGKQIGNDLRLSTPMPFRLIRERSSLIDLSDAREKMLRVYQRFVEDGKIDL